MRPMGGFGKGAEFQKQNSEGESVQDASEREVEEDTLLESSVNAKKQNPYGPQYPGLERYFKAGR